jgi:hypothetical protein
LIIDDIADSDPLVEYEAVPDPINTNASPETDVLPP